MPQESGRSRVELEEIVSCVCGLWWTETKAERASAAATGAHEQQQEEELKQEHTELDVEVGERGAPELEPQLAPPACLAQALRLVQPARAPGRQALLLRLLLIAYCTHYWSLCVSASALADLQRRIDHVQNL